MNLLLKKRLSNIELARLLSMFFILLIHANMVSLPKPTSIELAENTLSVILRYFFESLGIVSVDVFVMISGWFLIKTRKVSVFSFIYQVLFFWGGIYILLVLFGKTSLNIKGILTCFAFTSWDWFIKAYLVLFIIAPILNTFVENAKEKLQRNVLIWFFIFMCTYGLVGGASRFFYGGYTPLSFIGIYLLAQYAHNTSKSQETPIFIRKIFSLNKYWDLVIFFSTVFFNSVIGLLALYMDIPIYGLVYAYINPLTIIGALYFLLFFSKLKIEYNRIINLVSTSSFAVYLLHSQIDLRNYFTESVKYLFYNYDGLLSVVLIFYFLVLVYIISVIIDQVRILSWNIISRKIK